MKTAAALVTTCLVAFSLPHGPAAAQQPAPASEGSPVTVYLRALTADGEPIADLAAGDLSVKIAGLPRTVRSIQLLDFRPRAAAPAPAASVLPPPFATNDGPSGGRDLVIAIDDTSISMGATQTLQETLAQLVAAVSPRDRVGLLSVRAGGVNVGLTTRHETVRAGIAGLRAQGGAAEPCRGKSILDTLKSVVSSDQRSAPATVVFFSTGAVSDACGIRMDEWQAFGAAVQRSATNVYVAQVFEAGGDRSSFLENLAGMGGAEMIRLGGDTTKAMARIVRETSVAYRILLEPDRSDRAGATQRIEVRASRAGVRLAAPSSMTFAAASRSTAVEVTPSALLRGSTSQADLRLRVAAFPSRNATDDKIKVVAIFEPVDPSVKIAAAMVALFDERQQSVGQWTARRSDLARTPVLTALPVPSGAYRLRVAAVDANGRGGSADLDVEAVLTKGGALTFSALVLGAVQGGAFAPRLQFSTEPAAMVYFEIYGTAPGTLSARVEIASSPTGPALSSAPAQITSTANEGVRNASASVPIASLPSGDVFVRAVVSLGGPPVAQLSRTLRKQ